MHKSSFAPILLNLESSKSQTYAWQLMKERLKERPWPASRNQPALPIKGAITEGSRSSAKA